MPEPNYDFVRNRLRAERHRRNLTLRDAARDIGVSAPTLSRIERGASKPDVATLEAVIEWLDLDRGAVYGARDTASTTTAEAVEKLLRADPRLDGASADALARIFLAAYEGFVVDGA
jgi:transcriptional regulator with XRE-family HTH domain